GGTLYLCAVKEAWSRRIVGYAIDQRMTSQLAVDALRMAVTRRGGVDCFGHPLLSQRSAEVGEPGHKVATHGIDEGGRVATHWHDVDFGDPDGRVAGQLRGELGAALVGGVDRAGP